MRTAAVAILAILVPALAQAQVPDPGPAPTPAPAAGGEIEEIEEVGAEEVDPVWNDSNFPVLDRAINILTARTQRRNSFQFIVDHRTLQPIAERPWQDFLGFDAGGLRIGLGLRYGILANLGWGAEGLDVGMYRGSNGPDPFDTYHFDVRWQPLAQRRAFLDVALRGGLTWFSQRGTDAVGGFAQLLLTRTFFAGDRLILGSGLLYHSDSSGDRKSTASRQWSLAIPAYVEVRILPWLSWGIEGSFTVAGYGWTDHVRNADGSIGQADRNPALSTAIKFITARHVFAILVSNTQYITPDGIVANTGRDWKDVVIGFQITREWNLM